MLKYCTRSTQTDAELLWTWLEPIVDTRLASYQAAMQREIERRCDDQLDNAMTRLRRD